jgi:gliding motility-associated protein GldM
VFINGTLTDLLNEEVSKNSKLLSSIDASYNKKGKRPEHKKVLDKAKEIRETSKALITNLNDLKEKMITVSGGYEEGAKEGEHHKIIGVADYDKVGGMMLQTEVGKKFEKDLDDYVNYLNSAVKEYDLSTGELSKLTRPASEMDLFKDDPDHKNKDFLTITFDHTPTAAGLASVSQLGAEALEYESKILAELAKKVDAALVDFNIIVPKVMPKTEIVPLGSKYEADLMLVAGGKGVNPEMSVNGNKIEVTTDESGLEVGKISLPGGSAGVKSFKTEIYVPSSDTTFTATYSYEVIKPTMQITRGAASALYENCANELNVLVPMLGADFDPKYQVTNGKSIPGGKGTVEVVPTSRKNVDLNVYSGSVFIDKQTFAVKKVPAPEAAIMSGATKIDGGSANQQQIRAMAVRISAEENFSKEAPKDATYFVVEGRVLANGTFNPFTGPAPKLPPGRITGTVVVYVDKVARKRYDGSREVTSTSITKVIQVN